MEQNKQILQDVANKHCKANNFFRKMGSRGVKKEDIHFPILPHVVEVDSELEDKTIISVVCWDDLTKQIFDSFVSEVFDDYTSTEQRRLQMFFTKCNAKIIEIFDSVLSEIDVYSSSKINNKNRVVVRAAGSIILHPADATKKITIKFPVDFFKSITVSTEKTLATGKYTAAVLSAEVYYTARLMIDLASNTPVTLFELHLIRWFDRYMLDVLSKLAWLNDATMGATIYYCGNDYTAKFATPHSSLISFVKEQKINQ